MLQENSCQRIRAVRHVRCIIFLKSVIESELALHREENARLMAKITGLEFEKAELETRNAELEKELPNWKRSSWRT